MRIQRFLGELCIFKNRASSTENEHRAAQHIYQFMRSIGLIASIDPFKSQKRMTWELSVIVLFFLVEVVAYFNHPLIALISGFIGLILFWGYFTTRFKPLSFLFRFSRSHNVVGKLLKPDAPFKVIITAHYDTARSGPMWHPKRVTGFRSSFILNCVVIVVLQILSILKYMAITHIIFDIIMILGGCYILGQLIVLLIAGLKGELVQGASDNASGVAAMLDVAARIKELSIPEIEFWFVATGSEEVGAVGMAEFLKTYSEEEDIGKDNSYFINIDNVGQGKLHYFTGEGMINYYKFSPDLIKAAEKTTASREFKSVTPAKYRVAYTDAIVPASRGYNSLLLLAWDDNGIIPNWHWVTDTIDNINFDTVKLASDFTFTMINNLHEILKDKLKKNQENMKQFQEEFGKSEQGY